MPRCSNPPWNRATIPAASAPGSFTSGSRPISGWPSPTPDSATSGAISSTPWRAWRNWYGTWPSSFPLFLLSNTNALHFDYIKERFGLILEPFRAFILSYRVGSRKPEPAIYQSLIRQAGRPPEEILFLDDKVSFVAGALSQGLTAWQFRSPQELRQELVRHRLW